MPEQPSTLSRRALLVAGGVAGLGLFTYLQQDRAPDKQENVQEKRLVATLRAHPMASAEKLKRTPAGDESLMVFTLEDGGHMAETMLHLDNEGRVAQWTQENEQNRDQLRQGFDERNDDDGFGSSGSGFITERDGSVFIVSNTHVLGGAAPSVRDLMTMHKSKDLAAVPGEIVRRCEKDEYPLPLVNVSKISSQNLNGRRVTIQGMGACLIRAEGQALLLQEAPQDMPEYKGLNDSFALVVSRKDLEPFECAGMSGSRVEDEKGDVVGVFDSVIDDIPGIEDRFLMIFSGPEHLREVLAEAERSSVKNRARFDLSKLLQAPPKKDANVLPAGAQEEDR